MDITMLTSSCRTLFIRTSAFIKQLFCPITLHIYKSSQRIFSCRFAVTPYTRPKNTGHTKRDHVSILGIYFVETLFLGNSRTNTIFNN